MSVAHRKVLKSLLRGLFFYLIKINSALMQTFSLLCFSSSNRVGGVAHDCVKTASRSLSLITSSHLNQDREFFGYTPTKRTNEHCARARSRKRRRFLGIFVYLRNLRPLLKNAGVERPSTYLIVDSCTVTVCFLI